MDRILSSLRRPAGASHIAVAAVVYAVVVGDQLTKAVAASSPETAVAHNSAFALGVGGGPALVLTFAVAAAIFAFVAVIGRAAVALGVPAFVPALVVGGMIGNAIDRVTLGSVRDFLTIGPLIVNAADIAIAVGLVATVVATSLRLARLQQIGARIALDARALRVVVHR